MSYSINGDGAKLGRQITKLSEQNADSLEKLSTGEVFTSRDPRPTDRALASGLKQKIKSLASAKRGINDGISLLQIAESGFNEIGNIITRMKEINLAATNTTISNNERKFLFIEYQALFDEVNRIAKTTEFNGIHILNGADEQRPEEIIIQLYQPMLAGAENDINVLRFSGIKEINATTEGLFLVDPSSIIDPDEGVEREIAVELMEPEDRENFANSYDQALDKLMGYRAEFGAMQTRLQAAANYNAVMEENLSAARSKISDTDYAQEVSKLANNNILIQASTSLMSQSEFIARNILSLINSGL
jgi:flagellin